MLVVFLGVAGMHYSYLFTSAVSPCNPGSHPSLLLIRHSGVRHDTNRPYIPRIFKDYVGAFQPIRNFTHFIQIVCPSMSVYWKGILQWTPSFPSIKTWIFILSESKCISNINPPTHSNFVEEIPIFRKYLHTQVFIFYTIFSMVADSNKIKEVGIFYLLF